MVASVDPGHAGACGLPHVRVDTPISCMRCDAVCCRLTVLIEPGDRIASHLTRVTDDGLLAMDRDVHGWCVALDAARMNCSIYDVRPATCRAFPMGGRACRDARAEYARAACPSTHPGD